MAVRWPALLTKIHETHPLHGQDRDGKFVGIAPAAGCRSARSTHERHPPVDNGVGVTGDQESSGING